ncbi:NlpC-P60 family hydrolase [Bacteriovorax sp. DB6_IX]|nr:NlpC-P60 family hydrolase [Bacteriovorax sp. DB6_IX]
MLPMKKTLLCLFITISSATYANKAQELILLDQKLEKSFSEHTQQVKDFILKGHTEHKHYFLPHQRDLIISSVREHLEQIQAIDKYRPDKSHGVTSKKNAHRNYTRLLAKTIKYKHLAKFFNFSFIGKNPYVSVLAEDHSDLGHSSKEFRKLIRKTLKQSWDVLNRNNNRDRNDREESLNNNAFFHLSDLYKHQNDLIKFEKKHNPLTDEQMRVLLTNTHSYMEEVDDLQEQIKEIDWKVGAYSPLYHLKVFLLKAASYVALPGKHKISLDTLKTIDKELEPGDIGLIQRYNKLSNIVFKGNWTHSLIYLGKYSKFASYFNSDRATQEEFKKRCEKENLQCSSFASYLMAKHPEQMGKYIKSDKDKDPIATIESLKPGVILYTMKKSMGWDNLVLLRPKKLTKRDKALAIATAFDNLGKPYDYNFNGQTNERFVCTELVSYSYSPDPRIKKNGLTWEMNYVMNKPVMYAFDVLETFFKRYQSQEQELDVVVYVKGENGEFGKSKRGNLEELLESVDITD